MTTPSNNTQLQRDLQFYTSLTPRLTPLQTIWTTAPFLSSSSHNTPTNRRVYTRHHILQLRHTRNLPLPAHLSKQSTITTPSTDPTTDVILPSHHTHLTFSSLQLPSNLITSLSTMHVHKPSPIQAATIPLALLGVDLIAHAKSGTGKTIAFVSVILTQLSTNPTTCVLVMVPTRELAMQVKHVVTALDSHIRMIMLVGGRPEMDDIQKLNMMKEKGGIQLVIGTPGRMAVMVEREFLQVSNVRLVVLDEADRLLESCFEQQVETVFDRLSGSKQVLAFSATFGDKLRKLLESVMKRPRYVTIQQEEENGDEQMKAVRRAILVGVRQQKVCISLLNGETRMEKLNLKIRSMMEVLSQTAFSFCMVFTNEKQHGRYIMKMLQQYSFQVLYTNADKSQVERFRVIEKVRERQVQILICTDLLARGMDFDFCDLVIQLDIPRGYETYLHRVGRAGRFGRRGLSVLIYEEAEKQSIQLLEKQLGFEIEQVQADTGKRRKDDEEIENGNDRKRKKKRIKNDKAQAHMHLQETVAPAEGETIREEDAIVQGKDMIEECVKEQIDDDDKNENRQEFDRNAFEQGYEAGYYQAMRMAGMLLKRLGGHFQAESKT